MVAVRCLSGRQRWVAVGREANHGCDAGTAAPCRGENLALCRDQPGQGRGARTLGAMPIIALRRVGAYVPDTIGEKHEVFGEKADLPVRPGRNGFPCLIDELISWAQDIFDAITLDSDKFPIGIIGRDNLPNLEYVSWPRCRRQHTNRRNKIFVLGAALLMTQIHLRRRQKRDLLRMANLDQLGC